MAEDKNGGKKKRGNPNLHKHGKKFSSDYQPQNYRQGTKWLTDLLVKELDSKRTIKIRGVDEATGRETVITVNQPTKDVLINSLLRSAAGGNIKAIEMVFDRVEGKVEGTPRGEGGGKDGEDDGIKQRVVRLADGTLVPLL